MTLGWVGVLLVRGALGACALLALPWLLGEVNYVSLEPGTGAGDSFALPRVAHARARSEGRAQEYVLAVRRQLNISSAMFCVAFEESVVLFALVLLEHAYGNTPWIAANWRLSLPAVLALIVLGLRTYKFLRSAWRMFSSVLWARAQVGVAHDAQCRDLGAVCWLVLGVSARAASLDRGPVDGGRAGLGACAHRCDWHHAHCGAFG